MYMTGDPLLTTTRVTVEGAATTNQTSIGIPGGFVPSYADVWVGGAMLSGTGANKDYDDSDGMSIKLTTPMPLNTQYRVLVWAPGQAVSINPNLYLSKANNLSDVANAATALANIGAVPMIGGTMTGLLILSGNPTNALGAAPKQYVDAVQTSANTKVAKAGDTMTGPLTISQPAGTPQGLIIQTGTYAPYIRSNSTNTSMEWVNSANTAVNMSITDAGAFWTRAGATISGGLTVAGTTLSIGQIICRNNMNFQKSDGSASMGYVSSDATLGMGIINAAGNQWNMSVSDAAGNLTARGTILSQAGGVIIQGWGGNTNNGVIYFGPTGNGKYLYYDGTQYNLTAAPLYITSGSSVIPTKLSNGQAGNYWANGPDSTNAFCVYNASGQGVFLSWGATAWGANSDETLKDIQSDLTGAVDAIGTLRTVKYLWKANSSFAKNADPKYPERVKIGVIAQDVQKVLPEAVDTLEDGTLGLRYQDLIPLALAAIKELSARVVELEARLK